jgi:hypothetical protein
MRVAVFQQEDVRPAVPRRGQRAARPRAGVLRTAAHRGACCACGRVPRRLRLRPFAEPQDAPRLRACPGGQLLARGPTRIRRPRQHSQAHEFRRTHLRRAGAALGRESDDDGCCVGTLGVARAASPRACDTARSGAARGRAHQRGGVVPAGRDPRDPGGPHGRRRPGVSGISYGRSFRSTDTRDRSTIPCEIPARLRTPSGNIVAS